MIRNTLTIGSLIALVLSLVAWGASLVGVGYRINHSPAGTESFSSTLVILVNGGVALYYTPDARHPLLAQYHDPDKAWEVQRLQMDKYGATVMHLATWGWDANGCLDVRFRLWFSTALFSAAIAAGTIRSLCTRGRRRRKLGLCVQCGYSLQGLTGPKCPECGTEFTA